MADNIDKIKVWSKLMLLYPTYSFFTESVYIYKTIFFYNIAYMTQCTLRSLFNVFYESLCNTLDIDQGVNTRWMPSNKWSYI